MPPWRWHAGGDWALGFHNPAEASDVGLVAYDYVSGLRAPAIIAIVKDAMVYPPTPPWTRWW